MGLGESAAFVILERFSWTNLIFFGLIYLLYTMLFNILVNKANWKEQKENG